MCVHTLLGGRTEAIIVRMSVGLAMSRKPKDQPRDWGTTLVLPLLPVPNTGSGKKSGICVLFFADLRLAQVRIVCTLWIDSD